MQDTKIRWCDHTFNPWIGWGCSHGANIEHDLALDLGLAIRYPEDWAAGFSYPW